ncbi:hypothetical protein PAECIP111891_06022 [Paenibacillus allorhizoplanae]|uniref:VOC domain-containing protein n=1 Tax=Paenibacillus allorhizoplanae TaxID=2905648 RepID=A0ABN8H8G8_9BACL|nr:VOC family protein [Paenibacillus allorhizoplanae]CAH1226892.1 hypothetical protein PAECIP111891_06022 [Paenibacillus allorhizoplanae]
MINNRSVPTKHLLPHLFYENVEAASTWLHAFFSFTEYFRFLQPDGQLHGVVMYFGDAWIMLKNSRPSSTLTSPAKLGSSTQSLMVFVEDIQSHYQHSKSSGADILEELVETEYGERHYVVLDLEGHQWIFSKHIKDISPDEWGAVVALSSMNGIRID